MSTEVSTGESTGSDLKQSKNDTPRDLHIYIDGEYFSRDDATVSVFDHGLLYGDGIFEGIRIYNGRVFMLREHLRRLYDSAKAILMLIPMAYDDMLEAVLETCRRNQLRSGYIRLMVTRGRGSLGLAPDSCEKPTIIIIADKIALYPKSVYEKGLTLATVPTRRNTVAALNPAVKSLNYLNNVMAKVEAKRMGAQEALMLNEQGYVAEGSGDNVFVVKEGKVFTPPISAGALGGLTRRAIFDLAKLSGKHITETNMTRYDLFIADEIFLTGTGAEIVPVISVDGRVVGDGMPGPFTGEMMRRFHDLTQTSGVPIKSAE